MASGPAKKPPPLALEQACRIWIHLPNGISFASQSDMQILNENSCLIIEQVSPSSLFLEKLLYKNQKKNKSLQFEREKSYFILLEKTPIFSWKIKVYNIISAPLIVFILCLVYP